MSVRCITHKFHWVLFRAHLTGPQWLGCIRIRFSFAQQRSPQPPPIYCIALTNKRNKLCLRALHGNWCNAAYTSSFNNPFDQRSLTAVQRNKLCRSVHGALHLLAMQHPLRMVMLIFRLKTKAMRAAREPIVPHTHTHNGWAPTTKPHKP